MNLRHKTADRQSDKQVVIMEAMTGLVGRYGYAKVTMDDIAKASGLSRPALYQFFGNKQEIYRAIASSMAKKCLEKMDRVFEGKGDAQDKIFEALKVGLLDHIAEMESTSHGAELLDLKNDLSADIISRFTEGMTDRIAVEFSNVENDLALPPATMAQNLSYWLEGMKTQVTDPKERDRLLKDFLVMQFASVRKG